MRILDVAKLRAEHAKLQKKKKRDEDDTDRLKALSDLFDHARTMTTLRESERRAQLAREVYEAVLDGTESFKDENIGSLLAYLWVRFSRAQQ